MLEEVGSGPYHPLVAEWTDVMTLFFSFFFLGQGGLRWINLQWINSSDKTCETKGSGEVSVRQEGCDFGFSKGQSQTAFCIRGRLVKHAPCLVSTKLQVCRAVRVSLCDGDWWMQHPSPKIVAGLSGIFGGMINPANLLTPGGLVNASPFLIPGELVRAGGTSLDKD